MKKLILLLSLFTFPLQSEGRLIPLEIDSSSGEGYEYRRIVSLFQVGDYSLARQQIQEFLHTRRNSPYQEALVALRGRVACREGLWEEALIDFETLRLPEMLERVEADRLQCLYRSERYAELGRITQKLASAARTSQEMTERQEMHLFFHTEAMLRFLLSDSMELSRHITDIAKDFARLEGTRYESAAYHSLAEAYRSAKNPLQAANCYASLAKTSSKLRSYALYQQGHLLCQVDSEEAQPVLLEVWKLGQAEALRALHDLCVLHFTSGDYQRVCDLAAELSSVELDSMPGLAYYIGTSYMQVGQLSDANSLLQQFLFTSSFDDPLYIFAFESALCTALKQEDAGGLEALCASTTPELQVRARIYQAALANQRGEARQALDYLKSHDHDRLPLDQRLSVAMQAARAHTILREWPEAFYLFLNLSEHLSPDDSRAAIAWKGLADCGVRCSESEDLDLITPRVLEAHKRLYTAPCCEQVNQCVHLAQCYAKDHRWHEVRKVLAGLTDFPSYSLHYLLASSYQQDPFEQRAFVSHTEQAASLCEDPEIEQALRQSLFQAYLSSEQRDAAAAQLELIAAGDYASLDKKQALWLARHYFSKSVAFDPASNQIDLCFQILSKQVAERAEVLFSSALKTKQAPADVLAWAQTAFVLNHWQQLLERLPSYLEQYAEPTTAAQLWALLAASQFHLGQDSEAYSSALRTAEMARLIPSTQLSTQYRVIAARLQLASNPLDTEQPLKSLRQVQAAKVLKDEPHHLEAALCFVDVQRSLQSPQDRPAITLQLLRNLKLDFTEVDDLWSKGYHASYKQFPKEAQIHESYLMLVDARIARTEAELAAQRGDSYEYEAHMETAAALFQALKGDKFSVSKYLIDQAQLGLTEIATLERSQVAPI